MKTIREQLAPFVRAAGVTATAKAVGLDQGNLSHWLAGRGRLADQHVEALCRHLQLTITVKPEDG